MSKWILEEKEDNNSIIPSIQSEEKNEKEVNPSSLYVLLDFLKERQKLGFEKAGGFSAFFIMLFSSLIVSYLIFVLVWGFVLGIQNSLSIQGLVSLGIVVLVVGGLYNLWSLFYHRRLNKLK